MKQLSILEMESINAGKAKQVMEIIDGACGVAGVIAVFGGPVGWGAAKAKFKLLIYFELINFHLFSLISQLTKEISL